MLRHKIKNESEREEETKETDKRDSKLKHQHPIWDNNFYVSLFRRVGSFGLRSYIFPLSKIFQFPFRLIVQDDP